MPPVDITWYDGLDNLPPIPEGYGVSGLDPNIPKTNQGDTPAAKLNPGKIIYTKDLVFKGGSHGSTLSIIPEEKAKEMAGILPEIPKVHQIISKTFYWLAWDRRKLVLHLKLTEC